MKSPPKSQWFILLQKQKYKPKIRMEPPKTPAVFNKKNKTRSFPLLVFIIYHKNTPFNMSSKNKQREINKCWWENNTPMRKKETEPLLHTIHNSQWIKDWNGRPESTEEPVRESLWQWFWQAFLDMAPKTQAMIPKVRLTTDSQVGLYQSKKRRNKSQNFKPAYGMGKKYLQASCMSDKVLLSKTIGYSYNSTPNKYFDF